MGKVTAEAKVNPNDFVFTDAEGRIVGVPKLLFRGVVGLERSRDKQELAISLVTHGQQNLVKIVGVRDSLSNSIITEEEYADFTGRGVTHLIFDGLQRSSILVQYGKTVKTEVVTCPTRQQWLVLQSANNRFVKSSNSERARVARELIESGMSFGDVARQIAVSESTLMQVLSIKACPELEKVMDTIPLNNAVALVKAKGKIGGITPELIAFAMCNNNADLQTELNKRESARKVAHTTVTGEYAPFRAERLGWNAVKENLEICLRQIEASGTCENDGLDVPEFVRWLFGIDAKSVDYQRTLWESKKRAYEEKHAKVKA
jgi:predicted transcriptional regulator